MSECHEVSPEGMEEENLTRHMAVALMRDQVDEPLTNERAYRLWASLDENEREGLRVNVRPLLPFVMKERARADALAAEVARLTEALRKANLDAESLAADFCLPCARTFLPSPYWPQGCGLRACAKYGARGAHEARVKGAK